MPESRAILCLDADCEPRLWQYLHSHRKPLSVGATPHRLPCADCKTTSRRLLPRRLIRPSTPATRAPRRLTSCGPAPFRRPRLPFLPLAAGRFVAEPAGFEASVPEDARTRTKVFRSPRHVRRLTALPRQMVRNRARRPVRWWGGGKSRTINESAGRPTRTGDFDLNSTS